MNALTRLAAMPRQKRLAGALAAVAVAMAISACGSSSSDQTIDPGDSTKLISELNAVQAAIDSRKCNQAEQLASDFLAEVNNLPESVGTDNKETLRNAAENLEKLAGEPSQCKPEQTTGPSGFSGDQSTSTTEPTTTLPPTTTETTTSSTTTTTSQPEPTGGGSEGNGGAPPPSSGGGGETGGGGGGEAGGGSGGTGGTGTGGTGGGTG